jgi:hypothetical protein
VPRHLARERFRERNHTALGGGVSGLAARADASRIARHVDDVGIAGRDQRRQQRLGEVQCFWRRRPTRMMDIVIINERSFNLNDRRFPGAVKQSLRARLSGLHCGARRARIGPPVPCREQDGGKMTFDPIRPRERTHAMRANGHLSSQLLVDHLDRRVARTLG